MDKVWKKVQNCAGESIAETLIAVLIIALALTMLAGMITATSNMIKTSKEKINDYYEANAPLETQASNDGTISVGISVGDATIKSESVNYKKNETFSNYPVVAYYSAADNTTPVNP